MAAAALRLTVVGNRRSMSEPRLLRGELSKS
jgi:hypothetical protein